MVNNYVQHWQCIRIITDRGRFKKIMTKGGGFRAIKKNLDTPLSMHNIDYTCRCMFVSVRPYRWSMDSGSTRCSGNRKVHVPLPARATSTWLIADRRLQHSAELRPARPRPHGLQVVLERRGGIGTDLATRRFRVRFVDLLRLYQEHQGLKFVIKVLWQISKKLL